MGEYMQTKTVAELSQELLILNKTQNLALYSVNGNIFEGAWNFEGQAKGMFDKDDINKEYKIQVTLDEATHTFNFKEHTATDRSNFSINPGGSLSFGGSKDTFSGKQFINKETETVIELGGQPGSDSYSYKLDTAQIKNPLLQILQNGGWQEKKQSFFGKVFGK